MLMYLGMASLAASSPSRSIRNLLLCYYIVVLYHSSICIVSLPEEQIRELLLSSAHLSLLTEKDSITGEQSHNLQQTPGLLVQVELCCSLHQKLKLFLVLRERGETL